MTARFVQKEVNRTSRNLVLVNVLSLIAIGSAVFANKDYYHNFFCGPIAADSKFLEDWGNDNRDLDFVSVAGDRSFETGLQQIRTRNGSREVEANYLILAIGDRLLVIKSEKGTGAETNFTGSLMPIPKNVYNEIVDELETSRPGSRQMFLPVMLSDSSYRLPGYIGFAFGLPLLIFNLLKIRAGLRRRAAPTASPITRAISRYGELAALECSLDLEAQEASVRFGRLTMTKSWLIHRTWFHTSMIPIQKVVWAYPHVTRHSVNFIPTGRTFKAIVWSQTGETRDYELSKSECQEFLSALGAAAPWIVFGYKDELKNLWNKKRSEFLAAVEERRKQVI